MGYLQVLKACCNLSLYSDVYYYLLVVPLQWSCTNSSVILSHNDNTNLFRFSVSFKVGSGLAGIRCQYMTDGGGDHKELL